MIEMKPGAPHEAVNPSLDENISRVDQDLQIMEAHSAEMAAAEEGIQDSMKKWDREYKDSHFHSVPRGRKHQR